MEIEDKYLSAENTQDGDIIEFIDTGVEGEIKQKDGSIKKVYNFTIKKGSSTFIYTPSNKALKVLIKGFGKETNNWVGKKVQLRHVNMEINGREMIVIRPQLLEIKA